MWLYHDFLNDLKYFEIKLDLSKPDFPPKILSKNYGDKKKYSTISDGRDLLKEIIKDWNPKTTITQLTEGIINFVIKLDNSNDYQFYGTFHLGEIYYLKSFNSLYECNSFDCKIEINDN